MENYKKITSSNDMQISEMTSLSSTRIGEPSNDYDLPIEKDIPITQDNISSDYYRTKKKTPTYKTTRKGNMIMMCYNSNGEPLIVIGPHWPFTICMMIFINTITFFYFHFLKNILHNIVKNIGLGISCVQIMSYILIFLINPGIPQKELWIENYFKSKTSSSSDDIGSYRICNICKIIMKNSDNTQHCEECNICIKGVDHHCSWISKCVTKKTKKLFFIFLISTFLLLIYFVLALVSIIFINNKK